MIEPYSEIAIHSEKKGYYMNHTLTKEYLLLFNALTDTEETLRQLREDLIAGQRQAEELFLSCRLYTSPDRCGLCRRCLTGAPARHQHCSPGFSFGAVFLGRYGKLDGSGAGGGAAGAD